MTANHILLHANRAQLEGRPHFAQALVKLYREQLAREKHPTKNKVSTSCGEARQSDTVRTNK